MTRGRGNFRSMPADFTAHMTEPLPELQKRYRATSVTLQRWRDLCGYFPAKGRPGRAIVRTDRSGGEVVFGSLKEAAEHTRNGSPSKICTAARRGGTSCGFRWRYADRRA